MEFAEAGVRRYLECRNCRIGEENGRRREEMSKRGTCGICGRENMSLTQRVFGVFVCGHCTVPGKSAEAMDLDLEDVQEEIKQHALLDRSEKRRPHKYSWQKEEEKPAKPAEGIAGDDRRGKRLCVNRTCRSYANCFDCPEIPQSGCKNFLPGISSAPVKHESPGPHYAQKGEGLISSSQCMTPRLPDTTITINLKEEPEIAEMLKRRGRKQRRSNLSDVVLAILDEQVETDQEKEAA